MSSDAIPQQMEPMLDESGQSEGNNRRQGSLPRYQGQGSLPRTRDTGSRNAGSMDRGSSRPRGEPRDRNENARGFLGSVSSGGTQRENQRLELQRHCERDTRFFAAFQFVLLILQAIHSSYLSYVNKQYHKSVHRDTSSGGFVAAQVLFPLFLVLASVPACMWIAASAWDFCDGSFWTKLKSKKGFIAFHVSMMLSTLMYTIHIIYLMGHNFNDYMKAIGSDAACFCNDVTNPQLNVASTLFHCKCMVPNEIPWHIATTDMGLVDDLSLQNVGSNYTGHVVVSNFNTTQEMFEQSEAFVPELKRLVYVMEICVLTISIRVLTWGWTSEYAWRKMSSLPDTLTIDKLRSYRTDIMTHAVFCLGEGVDLYALLTDLMAYARDLTASRGTASWLMATCGIGSIIAHVILPCAFVKFVQLDPGERYTNRVREFLMSRERMAMAVKMVSVVMNLLLFLLRVSVFRNYGGTDGIMMPSLFMLFILKEIYVIAHKGSEFCIECWELKRK